MTVALQIRDVPEEVRDVIAARAAQLAQSMQAYLLDIVKREARLIHSMEMFDRTAQHRISIPEELSPERIVREGRETGFEIDR